MSQFIYFTPEEKARAQNTDLVSLLRAQGERPVRSGREFRTPNDPSITVRGNKWFDHSARVGGYAVSFVQRYYRLPYQEAVLLLLGRKNRKTYEQAKPVNEVSKAFALPEPYGTMRRMYAYLMRQRHIDREVISAFVHESCSTRTGITTVFSWGWMTAVRPSTRTSAVPTVRDGCSA